MVIPIAPNIIKAFFQSTLIRKDVDNRLFLMSCTLNWEELREDCMRYGIRNSTLSAQMPSESSSVVCNATNGIEPPRGYLLGQEEQKGTSQADCSIIQFPEELLHPSMGYERQ